MRLLLTLAVTVLAAMPASAQDCTPTTSSPEVDALGVVYVDNDMHPCECNDTIWIYQESNGIPGLQRDDHTKDDTCDGQIPSDTIIF